MAILARQKVEAESALATERQQAERVAAADTLEKQIAAIETSAGRAWRSPASTRMHWWSWRTGTTAAPR